jgi:hypothetical protein
MLDQSQSVADDLIEVGVAELGGRGAREVEQAVGDLRGAEGLLGDALEQRGERASSRICLVSICA